MDIYVVLLDSLLIGASGRLQGAELIKADYMRRKAAELTARGALPGEVADSRLLMGRSIRIVNVDLQDD